jgi:DsbC/DsbD-like thiol-disulfide interchange protein
MMQLPIILLLCFVSRNEQASADSLIHITPPVIHARIAEKSVMCISVAVKEGYHIQGSQPGNEWIIPTSLDISPSEIITTGNPSFPAAKKFRLEGTPDYLEVYDGTIEISVPFSIIDKSKKGSYVVEATLRYQACDDKRCFSPKTFSFPITVTIK